MRAVLASAEIEKKRKYLDAVEFRRGTFTPFVMVFWVKRREIL